MCLACVGVLGWERDVLGCVEGLCEVCAFCALK